MDHTEGASEAPLTAFGEFLRHRRLTIEKKSLREIANRCPTLSLATLSRWENGRVPTNLTPSLLAELARALEIAPSIMVFRYDRSKSLAKSLVRDEIWFGEFCRIQAEIDSLFANSDFCPQTPDEVEALKAVEAATRSYFMVAGNLRRCASTEAPAWRGADDDDSERSYFRFEGSNILSEASVSPACPQQS